jgi:hypothetical protein
LATRIAEASRVESGELEELHVNARVKISALWAATMLVFVYVDVFSAFRPDVRADLEAGIVGGFAVNEAFLLAITAYVVVPISLVFGTLVLRPRVCRMTNLTVAGMYALTIVAGAIGEWGYYVFGSAVEIALLLGVGYYSWTWPRQPMEM